MNLNITAGGTTQQQDADEETVWVLPRLNHNLFKKKSFAGASQKICISWICIDLSKDGTKKKEEAQNKHKINSDCKSSALPTVQDWIQPEIKLLSDQSASFEVKEGGATKSVVTGLSLLLHFPFYIFFRSRATWPRQITQSSAPGRDSVPLWCHSVETAGD